MSSIYSAGSSSNELAEQYSTQQAEKEKIRDQHEKEMDRLEKSYSDDMNHTRDRYEASLQNEYDRTYENLRNAKRKFTAEERNLERSGKERIHKLSENFRNEENTINRDGEQRIKEVQKKQALIEEYERNQALRAQSLSRNSYLQKANKLIEETDQKVEKLQSDKYSELEKRRMEHATALEQIHDHFEERRNQIIDKNQESLNSTQQKLDAELNRTLQKTAFNVSETESKIDDPFYHLNRLDSEFTDEGDFYQLRFKVPEHEMKNMKVQISGQNVQITGTRDNNATAVIDEGHDLSTRSYQTYSERFKLDVPVDAKSVVKTEEDGWIQYTIPKYGPHHPVREDLKPSRMALAALTEKNQNFKNSLPTPTVRKDRGSKTTT